MKNRSYRNRSTQWIVGMVALIFTAACSSSQSIPDIQTQVIPTAKVVEMTQVIQVTRIVQVTHIVEIPRVVTAPVEEPTAPPAPTEAPAEPAVPNPPEAQVLPIDPHPLPIVPKANNDLLVWYNFENDFLSSGYVSDISGNGFDAQINGTVNVDDGISDGNAIFFFGNS